MVVGDTISRIFGPLSTWPLEKYLGFRKCRKIGGGPLVHMVVTEVLPVLCGLLEGERLGLSVKLSHQDPLRGSQDLGGA